MNNQVLGKLSVMLQERLNLKWQHEGTIKSSLDFFLKMVALFAEYGFYGASINQAVSDTDVNRSSILNKVNKKQLYILAVDAAIEILNDELFNTIPNDQSETNVDLSHFFKALSRCFDDYWYFCVISLTGNHSNQESDLLEAIGRAQNVWLNAFIKLASFNRKDGNEVKAADNCLTYLISQIFLLKNKDQFQKNISFICSQLEKYLKKEITSLLAIENNAVSEGSN